MESLLDTLARRFPIDSEAAARLCISRQAYSQAKKRGRLSEENALRCAPILGIEPAAALLANAPAARYIPAPVIHPAPDLPDNPTKTAPDNTNYAFSDGIKKSARSAYNPPTLHKITSQVQEEAVDLIRWVYAVARLPADSPRFNWYVSRWAVPEKIAMAKAAGWFAEAVSKCPPIDPAWIRLVPAALAECEAFKAMIQTPHQQNRQPSSSKSGKARNSARLAA